MCRGIGCILLTIFNSALLIGGLALAIVGGLLKWNNDFLMKFYSDVMRKVAEKLTDDVEKFLDTTITVLENLSSPLGLAMFIVGLILLVVGLFGLVGTCCRVNILLYIFAAIVGLLVLAHIILLIIYAARKELLADQVEKLLRDSVHDYKSIESNSPASIFLSVFMPTIGCCGADGPADFLKPGAQFTHKDTVKGISFTNLPYPVGCCKFNSLGTGPTECPTVFTNTTSNHEGCIPKTEELFNNLAQNIVLWSLLPLGINILVIIFAIVMVKTND